MCIGEDEANRQKRATAHRLLLDREEARKRAVDEAARRAVEGEPA